MTDPGNLKPFGKRERPLILDVSQLARRVIWGQTNFIAVIQYQWSYSGQNTSEYPVFLRQMPFGGSWNLNTDFKEIIPLKPTIPVVEAKISPEQRKTMLLWDYVPNKTANSSSQTITATVIDKAHFVGYISGGFPFFGTDTDTAEHAYQIFVPGFVSLFGRPPDPLNPNDMFVGMTTILESHTETTTRTTHVKTLAGMAFLNLSLIAKEHLPLTNPKLEFQISLGAGTNRDGIFWTVDVSTWRNNLEFPPKRYLSDFDPKQARMDPVNWDVTKMVAQRSFTKLGGGDFPPMPLTTLTIGIDCVTLAIIKAQQSP